MCRADLKSRSMTAIAFKVDINNSNRHHCSIPCAGQGWDRGNSGGMDGIDNRRRVWVVAPMIQMVSARVGKLQHNSQSHSSCYGTTPDGSASRVSSTESGGTYSPSEKIQSRRKPLYQARTPSAAKKGVSPPVGLSPEMPQMNEKGSRKGHRGKIGGLPGRAQNSPRYLPIWGDKPAHGDAFLFP